VLVPLDGSSLAEEALPGAMALARAFGGAQAAMHLFMVVDLYETTPQRVLHGHALDTATKYLAGLGETLGKTGTGEQPVHITWSAVAAEDVATAILKTAERGGENEQGEPFGASAAIGMATHGRSGVARLVLGSVTERVLESTRLPIFIVRARTGATSEAQAAEKSTYAPTPAGYGAVMPPGWRHP
jgi:nucleotide-binding universal stress UspA family protein